MMDGSHVAGSGGAGVLLSWFCARREAGFTSRMLLGVEGDPHRGAASWRQGQSPQKSVCGHHRARRHCCLPCVCTGCCGASRNAKDAGMHSTLTCSVQLLALGEI